MAHHQTSDACLYFLEESFYFQTIYGDLPRVSQVVLHLLVNFFRATNEVVSPLILSKSSVGRRSRKLTYPSVIARDSAITFLLLVETSGLGIHGGIHCAFDINCGRKMTILMMCYNFYL